MLLLTVEAYGTLSNPPLEVYSTYLTGTYGSGTGGIAIDSSGNAYVSGSTTSPDFPFTSAPLGPPPTDYNCNFVTKLNPSGTAIVWSVCLTIPAGGPIAVDAAGSVYVGGGSSSGSAITKLTPSGDGIVYSTSIPLAYVTSLALDSTGNVYLTGTAGPGLQTTAGAYQTQYMAGNCSYGGQTALCNDAFVIKLDPTGAVVYGTYLGTRGGAQAIALDSHGSVWVAGATPYPSAAFVAKLDAAGATLPFSRFFGGGIVFGAQTTALGLGIAVDSQDAVYAVGQSGLGVPTTPEALDPNGPSDQFIDAEAAYVLKFNSTGMLVYGTYVGSSGSISAVAVDGEGNAFFGMNGTSISNSLPPNCTPFDGDSLIALSPDGSKITSSSNYPGPIKALLLDGKGGVFITGTTDAEIFVSTPQAFQTQASVASNAFAAKFDFSQPAGLAFTCLVNAASLSVGLNNPRGALDGSVAPGELVTLFGSGFAGPELQVTFDGISAPVTYSDAGQINAVVPFEVGQVPFWPLTFVFVRAGAQTFGPVRLPTAPAMPGMFTLSGNGLGQAAALNQDGSVNSSANPATAGSVITVFITGVGDYNPSLPDGALGPLKPPFPKPVLPMSAIVNSEPAPLLFVGQAPGLIAGVVQVNVRIPGDAKSGQATLAVAVGNYGAGATVSIR
jgi:uncharacterized protein (TIGR03437 family)